MLDCRIVGQQVRSGCVSDRIADCRSMLLRDCLCVERIVMCCVNGGAGTTGYGRSKLARLVSMARIGRSKSRARRAPGEVTSSMAQ